MGVEIADEDSAFVFLSALPVVPSFSVLFLSTTNLRGQLPTELGLLSNLQHLELRLNELSGLIPTELGSLTSLVQLSLGKFAALFTV